MHSLFGTRSAESPNLNQVLYFLTPPRAKIREGWVKCISPRKGQSCCSSKIFKDFLYLSPFRNQSSSNARKSRQNFALFDPPGKFRGWVGEMPRVNFTSSAYDQTLIYF